MYCGNCGKKLEEDSRFCDNCGAKVEEAGPIGDMVEEPNQLQEDLPGGGEAACQEEAVGEGAFPSEIEAVGEGAFPSEGEAVGEGAFPSEGEAVGEGALPSAGEEAGRDGELGGDETACQAVHPDQDGTIGQTDGTSAEASAEAAAEPQVEEPAGEAGAPRKKAFKWNKLAWVELAVLLAFGFGFYRYVGTINDPATIARQYCDAMAGKDVARAYGCLAIPEDGFLTEEAFFRAVEAGGYDDVVNYKVHPLGGDQKDEGAIARDFEVRYIQSGGQREFTEKIRLVKGRDKKYFLFDEWKVSPGSLLVEDIGISAPELAEVSVDGVALEPAEVRDGMRRYQIDSMFQGDYTVSVSAPGFKPYSVTMGVGHDGEALELEMGNLSDETALQLTGQAADDLQGLMSTLLNNQPSQLIADSVSPTAAQMGESYESTRGGLGLDSYQYTKSTISDLYGKGFTCRTQEDGLLVSLDLYYHWSYEYIRSKQSFLGNAPMQREKDVVSSFTYQYRDGSWQLYGFEI